MEDPCKTRGCVRVAVPECPFCGNSHVITRHIGHLFKVTTTAASCPRERDIELSQELTDK